MKIPFSILFLLFTLIGVAQSNGEKAQLKQAEKELFRKGNDLYKDENYVDAEVQYKKALEQNPNYKKATYNLGNAIYQQNRFKEAMPLYDLVSKTSEFKLNKAESYHNMGNTLMKEKQYDKAVEAYKNALRNNHKDDETRYNLALAQKMLKDQQNQNKDNNKDQQDQENKDQDKKDNENKDKDKENEKEEKGDNKQEQKDRQQQPSKPQQNKLTPEQIKQLLEAMNNEENKTQQKVNAKKTQGSKVKQEKDW